MEDCIKKTVLREERQRGKNKNIAVDVHVLKKEENHETFIQDTLKTSTNFRNTNSASQKDKDKGYYIFYCIRSGNPCDGSYKTSGCMAYTSFKVKDDWLNHKVIVQRTSNDHNGHNAMKKKDTFKQCVQIWSNKLKNGSHWGSSQISFYWKPTNGPALVDTQT